ncbi:hypothetical protein [Nocardia sp. IFM 10818]
MGSNRDECRVTVDGVAPAVVAVLRTAERIAADNERTWICTADILAALIEHEGEQAPRWWPRDGKPRYSLSDGGQIMHHGADGEARPAALPIPGLDAELGEPMPVSYDEFRDRVRAAVPGPTPKSIGSESPASVAYEISGPHAEEFIAMIERAG